MLLFVGFQAPSVSTWICSCRKSLAEFFGIKRPDPKSIAADENQSIDLNWPWGGISDAEEAKIAGGLGIAVYSCHLGTTMKRLELALF